MSPFSRRSVIALVGGPSWRLSIAIQVVALGCAAWVRYPAVGSARCEGPRPAGLLDLKGADLGARAFSSKEADTTLPHFAPIALGPH
jgi:hypothetical protein